VNLETRKAVVVHRTWREEFREVVFAVSRAAQKPRSEEGISAVEIAMSYGRTSITAPSDASALNPKI
jgi:hypothetical protein